LDLTENWVIKKNRIKRRIEMDTSDKIQIIGIVILIITLIIMAVQTFLQNRLMKAQLLKDRYEMYMKTYEPVSEEEINELELYPRDYMSPSLYEAKYKNNRTAIKRYIYMYQLYDFLGFTYTLKKKGISDPIGEQFNNNWLCELLTCSEFIDVHNEYKSYFPKFQKYINDRLDKKKIST
jgi:hypothetical protein